MEQNPKDMTNAELQKAVEIAVETTAAKMFTEKFTELNNSVNQIYVGLFGIMPGGDSATGINGVMKETKTNAEEISLLKKDVEALRNSTTGFKTLFGVWGPVLGFLISLISLGIGFIGAIRWYLPTIVENATP